MSTTHVPGTTLRTSSEVFPAYSQVKLRRNHEFEGEEQLEIDCLATLDRVPAVGRVHGSPLAIASLLVCWRESGSSGINTFCQKPLPLDSIDQRQPQDLALFTFENPIREEEGSILSIDQLACYFHYAQRVGPVPKVLLIMSSRFEIPVRPRNAGKKRSAGSRKPRTAAPAPGGEPEMSTSRSGKSNFTISDSTSTSSSTPSPPPWNASAGPPLRLSTRIRQNASEASGDVPRNRRSTRGKTKDTRSYKYSIIREVLETVEDPKKRKNIFQAELQSLQQYPVQPGEKDSSYPEWIRELKRVIQEQEFEIFDFQRTE